MRTRRQKAILTLIAQADIGDGDKSLSGLIAGEIFDVINDIHMLARKADQESTEVK